MDIDYIDQLSDEEKAWLNKFMNETLNASFNNDKNDLIKDQSQKRKIYNENNARNRCIYTVAKATNRLLDIEEAVDMMTEEEYDMESELNEKIDYYRDLLKEED